MLSYTANNEIYTLKHWSQFRPVDLTDDDWVEGNHSKKKVSSKYVNKPFVFDSEVTSWRNPEGIKRASMYVWTAIVFDNTVYYGRKTSEIPEFLKKVIDAYGLDDTHKAVCYVHNLPYDGHFFLPWIADNMTDMFAIDSHTPVSFTAYNAIEFKCSLILANKSLDKIGKDIGIGKVKGFDYSVKRHYETELTDEEWKYCMFDVIVLANYITGQIKENDNKITNISKTFTGVTRRESRARCAKDPEHIKMYNNCKVTDLEIMDALEHAFQGGYTHSNSANAGLTLENVDSYDLSSDYPSQMVKQKFPVEKFRKVLSNKIRDPEEWASIIKISFTNIRAKTHHSIISTSKIINALPEDAEVDNGRLIETTGTVTMWITEMDYITYKMFYTWDSEVIHVVYASRKGYLSKPYVTHCLELYKYKTTLKGETDPDKELLYKMSKMMINSLYGMSVTNPMKCKWIYEYNGAQCGWQEEIKTRQQMLDDLNTSYTNFLSYQWGVWVTAYARYDLLRTVKAISDQSDEYDIDGRPFDDVVYCDTDSIKILNGDKHKAIFDTFNAEVETKMQDAMKHFGFAPDEYSPKDPKGRPRPLGIFAYEPNEVDESLPSYRYFKTLGAKRYIFSCTEDWTDPKAFGITIAGLPKKNNKTIIDMAISRGVTPFEVFEDGLKIPETKTGKNTVTYVDEGFSEPLTDYKGNTVICTERAYIHIENAPFAMGVTEDFIAVMNRRKRGYIK